MPIPTNYAERVYAGVLGKIIGVYLGRPFEGWGYDKLTERFGEVDYYVHEQLGCRLVVADDDISGTFTFLRALQDFGYDPDLAAAQIGKTWQNYIIEGRTILWWGGMGLSTEHTAFLRLKAGIEAPASGSIAANSQVVAEQIGAQIFIDGWGMVCPGDPAKAADLARRAASVSHDGEAIYGAQVVAALVAAAFVESDIDKLLDIAVAQIPASSLIARLIGDLRARHASGETWREGFKKIDAKYGYHIYGGNCHMVPNHALIIHALLHGGGDLNRSLMIVNTCGWDTDCNSGNVGAILGVRNGLAGFDGARDWRGPIADRLYLPTADGGRGISDAVLEAREIVCAGRALAGLVDDTPAARYAFEFSGSVQGFLSDDLSLSNPAGGELTLTGIGRAATATFVPVEDLAGGGYGLVASPTIYAGQTVRALISRTGTATVSLFLRYYGPGDQPVTVDGPTVTLAGRPAEIVWTIPSTDGRPIFQIGIAVSDATEPVALRWLTWDGEPETSFDLDFREQTLRGQWVSGFDRNDKWGDMTMLQKNSGRGLLTIGTADWRDYRATATINPHLVSEAGVLARYQGLERYYALLIGQDNRARLIKRYYGETVLADAAYDLVFDRDITLAMEVNGAQITGSVNGIAVLIATDHTLTHGGIGIAVADGWAALKGVAVAGL